MAKKNNASGQNSRQQSRSIRQRIQFPWYLALMPIIIALWGYIYFEKGEIIALNNGCGWDGVVYKNVVWSLQWNTDSPEYRERGRLRIDPYRVQRIAPSVAVYGEMQTAKYLYQRITPIFSRVPSWLEWSYEQYPLPPWFFRWFAKSPNEANNQHTVALTIDSFVAGYFVFHSLFMLMGAALFWGLSARALKLGAVARWLGFVGLFVNFAVMKMSFYYPTLTDTTALFISTVMLYAYLADISWLLLASAAIGFFTFPTAFYVAVLLFIFPRGSENTVINEESHTSKRSAQLLAGGATLVMLLLSVYLVIFAQVRFAEVEPIIWILLPLTIPLMLGQFYITVENLLLIFPTQTFIKHIHSEFKRYGIRTAISILLWGVLFYCKKQIEDPTLSSPMNVNLFLGGSFSSAVSKPLLAIVASVVYFGPAILVIVLHYRRFIRTALQIGNGYFFVIGGMLLLATIMTETRQLINFLPFIIVGVATMLNTASVRPVSVVLFSAISIVCSKIWLPLNFVGMQEQAANIHDGTYTIFPLQYYFMNHGPWMSMTSYLVQSAVVAICLGLLLWLFSPQFSKKS
jgi:hypothetical protein